MKTIQFILVVLLTSLTFAQNNIEKEIGDFSEIKVFDLIEAELIKADQNKVIITGANIDDVRVINDKGTLKLRMKLDTRFNGNDTNVKVYHTGVSILDANEGSEITSRDTFTQSDIVLKSQEGGKINVTIAAEQVECKAVSGGIIYVDGVAKNQKIVINSGGIFEGENLKTENTKVKVTAGGSAEVHASEMLDAKVTAGGNIYVYGNPKDIKKKKFAGGKIVMRN